MDNDFLKYLTLNSVFIITEILIVFTMLHMLYQRRSPTSMISWLLLMIILPYFSLLLYFLIGVRKRPVRKKKSSLHVKSTSESSGKINSIDGIIRANGITGASEHNSFEFISESVNAYNILINEIKNAKKSISFSTYILKQDKVTKTIINALIEKESSGVHVRLLVDSLGSYKLYFFQGPLRKLRKAGCEVHFFMPLLRLPYQNSINLRNHRKIYLFDETTLLTGGMNLSNKYMGPAKKQDQCEDILFKTQGDAAYQYAQIFEADWAYASDSPLRQAARPLQKVCGDAYIQVVPSGPDIKGDALYEALISAIHSAKERIWIVTPYFLPDETLMHALKIAKHNGVDIKLITPKQSDHLVADLGRSSYMRELQEEGINLVLYKGKMLHAKAILFDRDAVMIGSVNIDNRSLLLNYEVVSFAYSKAIIYGIEKWMQGFITKADTQMQEASRLRRIAENFMRIIAPQL
ncbi:MAG: cardiolipin synthase [Psychromonas sp.]|jgi:cardiolipin synthase|uniref:phospholipase D-like domain-containing protein n=1 Tax=Psychromonas sp. TaxID=1884585 RepID=UPI0039E2B9B9